jgi:hypothetical protein
MSERLDRIESILDRIAQRQEESDRKFEETKAIVQSNARAIQAATERQNEFDRKFEQRQEESDRKFEETKAIVQSNGRAIQAMLERQESERLEHEEKLAKYDESIARMDAVLVRLADVQEGMAKWLANVDDNQPTILRRLISIENKIDRLIDNNS